MTEAIQLAMLACGVVAGLGYGLAAVIRAYYDGQIGMRLADLGKLPPAKRRLSLLGRPRKTSRATHQAD